MQNSLQSSDNEFPQSSEDNFCLFLLLAFIGGFTDASSIVNFNVFTGHLTGNSILGIVYLAKMEIDNFILSITSLVGFFSGSILGSYLKIKIVNLFKDSIILGTIVFLFFVVAIINHLSLTFSFHLSLPIIFISLSMGIQNGYFNKNNGTKVHSTYITGMVTSCISIFLKNIQTDNSKKILFSVISSFILGGLFGSILSVKYYRLSFDVVLCLLLIAFFISLYSKKKHYDS